MSFSITPQLSQNNSYQPERSERLSYLQGKTNLEKNVNEMSIFDNPSLKQMLALSENSHNNLPKHYSALDDKLPANNHRAFMGSQGNKRLYRNA